MVCLYMQSIMGSWFTWIRISIRHNTIVMLMCFGISRPYNETNYKCALESRGITITLSVMLRTCELLRTKLMQLTYACRWTMCMKFHWFTWILMHHSTTVMLMCFGISRPYNETKYKCGLESRGITITLSVMLRPCEMLRTKLMRLSYACGWIVCTKMSLVHVH